MDKFEKFAVTYLVMALLTFGYASNAEYAENEMINVFGNMHEVSGADRASAAIMPAIVWPLYLSYKVFYFARPQNTQQKQ